MTGADPIRNRALAAAVLLLAIVAALTARHLLGDRASAATATAAKSVTMASNTFRMKRADEKRRLVVRCPHQGFPLGGGMIATPAPGAGGEGVYPHSYERLGLQHGWHVTAVLYDPTPRNTRARKVRLQVFCSHKLGHVTPPHTTTYVKPGQTKTVVAKCPGHRHLFSGGFQRTDFVTRGGNFVTESRAISGKAWRVVGHAFGGFGGELTAIAYCVRSGKPLLREVSDSSTLGGRELGTAKTPSCPRGRRLTVGGFSTSPSGSAFFTNGAFRRDGGWSASAFNRSPSQAKLTAYGYCLKV